MTTFKLLKGTWAVNQVIKIAVDDKFYFRKVHYRRDCGLYVVVQNRMYFEYECDYSEVYKK